MKIDAQHVEPPTGAAKCLVREGNELYVYRRSSNMTIRVESMGTKVAN